jgi:hypothetical protein
MLGLRVPLRFLSFRGADRSPASIPVRAGLATATSERIVMGSREMEAARLRITDAGRQH